ncbi:prenylated Rab acceptor protein 1, partial [Alligator sinensis]|uniref:PRA1 family protein n=1 Tax=Alligator sinensis TaxID=38654 RepID=A0A1U8DH26_ALLSI
SGPLNSGGTSPDPGGWSGILVTWALNLPPGVGAEGAWISYERWHGRRSGQWIQLTWELCPPTYPCVPPSITSPLLVVALAVFLGACYVLHVRAQQGPLVVLGRELSAGQQYAVAGGVSFPLFWVAGAGSAVFWVLGATLVVIGSHAAFYETEPAEGEELQMEPV